MNFKFDYLKFPVAQGASIILIASVFWGIGNTITGITAQKYISAETLFPAVDISLANTLGGLSFLILIYIFNISLKKSPDWKNKPREKKSFHNYFKNKFTIISGSLKGINTTFFVFSTTYIAATQSIIFESTYIIWSLIFAIIFIAKKINLISSMSKAILLFIGVVLVSSNMNLQLYTNYFHFGAIFGIFAGLAYATYLFFWSFITKNLITFKSKLNATINLLFISFITILIIVEIVSIIISKKFWIPFTSLASLDLLIQFLNGIMVIGLVYLLITMGMSKLRESKEGANYIAAICLSFSIVFTFLTELIIEKFIPNLLQIIGILIFIISFILLSITLQSESKRIVKKIKEGD